MKFIFHVSFFIHRLANPAILLPFSSPYNTAGWLAGLDSALSAGMGCSLASERFEEGN